MLLEVLVYFWLLVDYVQKIATPVELTIKVQQYLTALSAGHQ
jgi:hypothetical protein